MKGRRSIKDTDATRAFGCELAKLRMLSALTQAELSERCGISRSWVAMIERGKFAPGADQVRAIARLFPEDGVADLWRAYLMIHLPIDDEDAEWCNRVDRAIRLAVAELDRPASPAPRDYYSMQGGDE